jgi:gliding motility-associated-like protein
LDPNPNASFSPGLTTLSSLNTVIQFNNTSTNADNYVWEFGDNTPNSTEVNPAHMFPDQGDGTYTVTLWAYADNGCYDSIQSSVVVNEELIFYVPNSFTPDGDDFNEYFKAIFTSGYDPYDFHLMIFNRWGEVIWESYDDSVGWDGTYGGKYIVQDGTYTWKIDFKRTSNDERIMVVGHVNVLR